MCHARMVYQGPAKPPRYNALPTRGPPLQGQPLMLEALQRLCTLSMWQSPPPWQDRAIGPRLILSSRDSVRNACPHEPMQSCTPYSARRAQRNPSRFCCSSTPTDAVIGGTSSLANPRC
ncbi:hypothetical protein BAUCODRAFT_525954 [Baudoinia panamericana UAMH 10762]|uniref:Uncharacterized protein n=1 Tax=Baudoinia panamericana (strain UAMH 10762) TaxID=717646 RepID=M2N8F5_BAUPA|nr:uncharacterized protein BAUCODRAFT_525954 [Baudoinia panamericana UAMH 10762]EMC95105.1 hypothetical protein BAUCODRAFT_525954 [Baudoinia panamericana UAMH 10762]